MKVAILGAEGMAGHMIAKYLRSKDYAVSAYTRRSLDVENFNTVSFDYYLSNPDFVVNCIGVLGPDSNKDPAKTILINSWFPHFLEQTFKNTKTRVIHISTDCVFDGERGYYIETDMPTETNIYGRSKAFGEINNDKDITLRMSIIGTEIKEPSRRSGLLNWVISNPNNAIQGWTQSIWNGITTLELAKQIHNYIQNPTVSGIYHLVPSFTISKYDLVSTINDVFECGKEILCVPGKAENKTLLDTRKESIFTKIPSYREQLVELKEF